MDRAEAAHSVERASLKEKLERLQRANKQRRAEIETMQGKLSSLHQRASAYDQVLRLRPPLSRPPSAAHAEPPGLCGVSVK